MNKANTQNETAAQGQNVREAYEHDVCPKCGNASVPAEKVPDQALRACSKCGHDWFENLDKPPTTATAQPENNATFETVRAERTFPAPRDYGNRYGFKIKAEAYKLNGNVHPHFAVTGDIYHKATRTRTGDGTQACGCLHDEAAKAWPSIRPIIALHLSNADNGEPMHAEANGYYWLAGAVGGLGEQYHGASGSSAKTPEECLHILANHLRISLEQASDISNEVRNTYDKAFAEYEVPPISPTLNRLNPFQDEQCKTATIAAKNAFHAFVTAQRDRWEKEAQDGIALIRKLGIAVCD